MEWAPQFAERVEATLRFVHVVAGPDAWPRRHVNLEPKARSQQEALRAIESLQKDARVKAPVSVATGGIAHGVCEEARNYEADLVVIGRGRVHDTAGRLGKHACEIIRLVPCPVISV